MRAFIPSIIFLLSSVIFLVEAHNIYVKARTRECFFEDLQKGDKMTVTFVSGPDEDGNSEIDFWMNGPSGASIVTQDRMENGDFSFDAAEHGTYQYCFSNEYESSGAKEISFNVYGTVYVSASSIESDPLEKEVRLLGEMIQHIKDEQEYIKIRERVHRNTAESTNSRVKWWSIFQTGVLVGVCIFQVSYLKRFFEVKRVV